MSLRPQDRFAANLRRARVASGVSQEELGRRCDLHRTEISLLERAGREPRLGTITKLASALGIEPAVLHEGIAWSPQRSAYVVEPPAAPTAPAAPPDRPKKLSGGGAGAGC